MKARQTGGGENPRQNLGPTDGSGLMEWVGKPIEDLLHSMMVMALTRALANELH